MSDQDPKFVALKFNEAINRRDLEGLVALMTEDHLFIDSEGDTTRGRDEMRAGWRKFFSAFPDYRNFFTTICNRGDVVFLLGHSTCSEPTLDGPAIWTAVIRDSLVAEWRVYEDNLQTRRLLQLKPGNPFE